MPRPNAARWDREEGKLYENWTASDNGKLVPMNRPCDECGKPVERGYIHEECIPAWEARMQPLFDLLL